MRFHTHEAKHRPSTIRAVCWNRQIQPQPLSPDEELRWNKNSDDAISAWSEAARIVFAFSPNSASCERVFALLKDMFGEQQMSALADYIQAALMLAYNKRAVV